VSKSYIVLEGDKEVSPRIGSVPYLNARPLLYGLTYPVSSLVPAELFVAFQNGKFDAALLSSIDAISMPHPEAVDEISISSRGDVYSVILAYTGELNAMGRVLLDPASHTSNALLQIILGEFHGCMPEYVHLSEAEYEISDLRIPRLLIGDRAIQFRKRLPIPDMRIMDLGGEWYRNTGLPFVYALWSLKHEFSEKKFLADHLRNAKLRGLTRVEEIAAATADPIFTRRYFSEWIRYDLGDLEKKGLRAFAEYLKRYQLVRDCLLRTENELTFY
jgi:predicted solute-binding protein